MTSEVAAVQAMPAAEWRGRDSPPAAFAPG
jgi:hypothetical protein